MPQPKIYVFVSPITHGDSSTFSLTYHTSEPLERGQIVSLPLARRDTFGIVLGPAPIPTFATRAIHQPLDLPLLPEPIVALAQWLHLYYLASPRAVWQSMLPAGLTKNRRALKADADSSPAARTSPPPPLTAGQVAALERLRSQPSGAMLLHGVTGSGKTRVYIELAREQLRQGRSCLILVPEISLTPQLLQVFATEFGSSVIGFHSGLTESRRHHHWLRALTAKQPLVAVGPRSALFLPFSHLGLIIVDESHETSYKQEQAPRYQALSVASKLAMLHHCRLIMGSATPSLFEVFLTQKKLVPLIEMPHRANQLTLPDPVIVDLRDKNLLRASKFISSPLLTALTDTLTDGRQSLLFINRRGSASSLLCGDCGLSVDCPDCAISLTFHADLLALLCHYCNYQIPPPASCPACRSMNLRYLGGGTKRIEAEITRLLPEARLVRLDRDSANLKHLTAAYQGLQAGRYDILIGTQMIAKGLDLPNVDTVGVVSADTMLHIPDFTASERTFQLLIQVSGRAGRGDRPGQVIIQTYTPGHPAVTFSATQDYWGFVKAELDSRRSLSYPPYSYLLKLVCARSSAERAQHAADQLAASIKQQSPNLVLLGPAPSFRQQQAGKFYWQLIAKSKSRNQLLQVAGSVPADWTIDLDPINLL